MTIIENAQRATIKGHGAETFVFLGHGKAPRESGPTVRAAKREHGSGYVLVNVETGEEVRGAGGGSATKFWAAPVPTVEIEAETTAATQTVTITETIKTAVQDEIEMILREFGLKGTDEEVAEVYVAAASHVTEGRRRPSFRILAKRSALDAAISTLRDEIAAAVRATEGETVEPRADCTDEDCAQAAREGHTPEEAERAIVTALVVSGEEFSVREVHGMVPRMHIIRRGVRSLCGRTAGAAGYRLDLGLVDCLACLDRYTEETRNSVPRQTCAGCGQSITAPNNLPAALRTAGTRQCETCDLFDRL